MVVVVVAVVCASECEETHPTGHTCLHTSMDTCQDTHGDMAAPLNMSQLQVGHITCHTFQAFTTHSKNIAQLHWPGAACRSGATAGWSAGN